MYRPEGPKAGFERQHHTPTIEEVTYKFQGATMFSKLDARSRFWSVRLDDESKLLTTFNSPFGRYCFNRLPFGLKTSQDIFQRAMDESLEGLPGEVSVADDIVVFQKNPKNNQEHDQNLHSLMHQARETGHVFPTLASARSDVVKCCSSATSTVLQVFDPTPKTCKL